MKKVFSMFIIGAIFLMMPLMAKAEEMKLASSTNNTAYGTINVSESKEWQNKPDGGKYIQQIYTVTKTSNGYVWIKLIETLNVKVTNVVEGSAFTLVSSDAEENTYLFKQKNGTTLSSETEVMTVIAEIVDPSQQSCNLSYSPMSLSCQIVTDDNGTKYFDNNYKEVTETEFEEACNGKTPPVDTDVPNSPDTGSVIPYIAVGGGLVAIAGVYLYSRKANKVYKI